MVLAHQIEAAIQPGRRAGRGDQVLIVHVEGIGIEPHTEKAPHEVLLVFPVGGGPASLQQAGVSQHIGAEAEPHHLGSSVVSGHQGV
ncbi:hypothetical protein D3C79_651310 [compost metagenome]